MKRHTILASPISLFFITLFALFGLFYGNSSGAIWHVAQDGSGDFNGMDEVPLRAAISQAKSSGGEIILKTGVYRIGKGISLDGVKHLRIRGEGAVILQLAPALVTELAAPAVVGENTLTLRSPEGLRVGLKLRVMAPGEIVALSGRPKPSFETVITAVDGATVTLNEPLRFAAKTNTRVVNDNDLNLFSASGDCEDITIENLTLDGALKPDGLREATHQTRCGFWITGRFDYMKGPSGPMPQRITVRDCHIRNFHGRGVAIYSAQDCLVENCVIENTLDEGIDLDHFAVRCRALGNIVRDAPIGIELNDVNECLVERNTIENCANGMRIWRWCKVEELNVKNIVSGNQLRHIKGYALAFQAGTSANIARDNVLEIPAGSSTVLAKQFIDAGTGNLMEGNRIEVAPSAPTKAP